MEKKFIGIFLITLALTTDAMPAASSVVINPALGSVVGSVLEKPRTATEKLLFAAVANNNSDLIETTCIDPQTDDINARSFSGATALHLAAQSGFVGCVRALIDQGADVNALTTSGQRTPLHLAAMQGHAECAQLLIDHSAGVNAAPGAGSRYAGWTALHFAAENGHIECAQLLMAFGADLFATITASGEILWPNAIRCCM